MRHAVILAGGSGTRLWPASRRARPKQFLDLTPDGAGSLLALALRRARGAVDGTVVVVTAADHAAMCQAEAEAAGVAVTIVGEPTGRNTAAALGLAAVHLLHRDPDAVIGALPADQHVGDEPAMARALERAFAAAERADRICTIGLTPSRPETGFGYLELAAAPDAGLGVPGVREVARFVEKPDAATAAAYVAGGRHLWNGGMFFLRARRLADELARRLPATWAALGGVAAALAAGADADAVAAATRAAYATIPSISIDHGVMEHAEGVVTVPADVGWSDVGSWAAVAELRGASADGNVTAGAVVVRDGRGNLAITDPGRAIALVGVSDLVVVQAGDAILVVPRDRAQDVRLAVEALAQAGLDRFL